MSLTAFNLLAAIETVHLTVTSVVLSNCATDGGSLQNMGFKEALAPLSSNFWGARVFGPF
jgi:hypothetical protein